VLNLGEKAEKVVEFDTEVFYHGCPGDGTVQHDDFAGRLEVTPSEKNSTAFVWIHVDSPGAKP
jgi:hypothetical protein